MYNFPLFQEKNDTQTNRTTNQPSTKRTGKKLLFQKPTEKHLNPTQICMWELRCLRKSVCLSVTVSVCMCDNVNVSRLSHINDPYSAFLRLEADRRRGIGLGRLGGGEVEGGWTRSKGRRQSIKRKSRKFSSASSIQYKFFVRFIVFSSFIVLVFIERTILVWWIRRINRNTVFDLSKRKGRVIQRHLL